MVNTIYVLVVVGSQVKRLGEFSQASRFCDLMVMMVIGVDVHDVDHGDDGDGGDGCAVLCQSKYLLVYLQRYKSGNST